MIRQMPPEKARLRKRRCYRCGHVFSVASKLARISSCTNCGSRMHGPFVRQRTQEAA